jgi:bacillithiol system protein YtxJ
MHPALKSLSGMDDLERALAGTDERPLLLFKHSFSCGVSVEALDELVAHLNQRKLDANYAMVTVQTHREVSNAVAKQLGVRHVECVAFSGDRGSGRCGAADAIARAATHADDHAH